MLGVPGLWSPLTVHPNSILALPGIVRAPLAFALVLLVGTAIVRRDDGTVERAIDAAIDHPVASVGYGIATHLTILFAGAYLASQLGQVDPSGRSLGIYGLWIGLALLVTAAGLGFTVVGSVLVESRWNDHRRYGLLVGALIAGLVALPDPLIGGSLWLFLVSIGIGGTVRTWFHATEDVDL